MSDPQQAEWDAFERAELAARRCPYSGGALVRRQHDDGPPDPTGAIVSCGVCDCFGYKPEEVDIAMEALRAGGFGANFEAYRASGLRGDRNPEPDDIEP